MTIIQAEKKIRNAWIVGLICGFITLFVALVEVTSGGGAIDIFSALLIFAFTVGIYMKNRVAAIGMFIYFLLNKLMTWGAALSTVHSALPMILAVILSLYLYFEGARGVIAYHRLREGRNSWPAPLASYVYPLSAARLRKRAWLTVLLIGVVLLVVVVASVMIFNRGAVAVSPLGSVIIASIVGGLASGALAALPRVGAPPSTVDGSVHRPEKVARARALRAAHGRRLGAILIAFSVLIFPAGIMLSAAAMKIGIGTGIIFPPLVFMAASSTLLIRGRRMRAPEAEGVLEDDQRPPIVYLRPFAVDRENRMAIAPDSFRGRTTEQEMARALHGIAPFVALGDPTEDLPELGAVRLYADDVEWQKKVEELTKRAGTIVLHAAGDSGSLAWEVQHVVGLGQPERIVLVQGSSYYDFCNAFTHLFPRGLLKYVTSPSQYLYFDADWTPRSFDEHSNIEARHGSPGEQREQVLRRLIKDCP